tara:strand:+ start:96 stop:737 length:642 start_codon:yes stop_codon:yes gene_type:complete
MDQDIEIINQNTRIEKIKNFFLNNFKRIIIILILIILILFGYFILLENKKNNKSKIAETYNYVIAEYQKDKSNNFQIELINIINEKDPTYSPLALYFLIDNQIINDVNEINRLFDLLIEKTKINQEIKNLIIYKKALFNSENFNENELLNILKPIINSESVWKSHSLYLLAEFFYSKNQREKSKEFYQQILVLKNANTNIRLEAEKKLNRDFK